MFEYLAYKFGIYIHKPLEIESYKSDFRTFEWKYLLCQDLTSVQLRHAEKKFNMLAYLPWYSDRQAVANNVDPDQTQINTASAQGLHCLFTIQQFLDTSIKR